jgi:hypothetical protein
METHLQKRNEKILTNHIEDSVDKYTLTNKANYTLSETQFKSLIT